MVIIGYSTKNKWIHTSLSWRSLICPSRLFSTVLCAALCPEADLRALPQWALLTSAVAGLGQWEIPPGGWRVEGMWSWAIYLPSCQPVGSLWAGCTPLYWRPQLLLHGTTCLPTPDSNNCLILLCLCAGVVVANSSLQVAAPFCTIFPIPWPHFVNTP